MRRSRMLLAALFLASGGGLAPVTAEVPDEPAGFSDPLAIDNPYHPFVKFRLRLYALTGGGEYAIDVFRPETRAFAFGGTTVECATMEEWAIQDGEIVEISKNWFAQADDGTVYYFGEVVDVFDGGVLVGHGGSWLVGGPGPGDPPETATATEPAVFMPAHPEVGDTWKSEDLPEAGIEEFNEVTAFRNTLRVPAGRFHRVLEVRGETPDVEHKWYAPGVGFVKSREGGEVLALVEIEDSRSARAMQEELEEALEELLGD